MGAPIGALQAQNYLNVIPGDVAHLLTPYLSLEDLPQEKLEFLRDINNRDSAAAKSQIEKNEAWIKAQINAAAQAAIDTNANSACSRDLKIRAIIAEKPQLRAAILRVADKFYGIDIRAL
jgi:hypothetical protein